MHPNTDTSPLKEMERSENSLVGAGVTHRLAGKGEQSQLPRHDPVRASGTRPDQPHHSRAHGPAAAASPPRCPRALGASPSPWSAPGKGRRGREKKALKDYFPSKRLFSLRSI